MKTHRPFAAAPDKARAAWPYPSYVQVPEVSYSPHSPVLRLSTLYPQVAAREVKQTGRLRYVRLSAQGAAEAFVSELPPGAVPRPLTAQDRERLRPFGPGRDEAGHIYGCLEKRSSGWKGVAAVAAVPVFVADIALTLATNVAAVPVALVAVPIQAATKGLQQQPEAPAGDARAQETHQQKNTQQNIPS